MSTPSFIVDPSGNLTANTLTCNITAGTGLNLVNSLVSNSWYFRAYGASGYTQDLYLGTLNNGGYLLDGSTNHSGWFVASDERIKKNIVNIEPSLHKVLQLKPSNFNYRNYDETGVEIESDDPLTVGFIAQNVEDFFPKCVKLGVFQNRENIKTVSYQNLIPYLVKAIQEQNEIIETIQTESKILHKRLNALNELFLFIIAFCTITFVFIVIKI